MVAVEANQQKWLSVMQCESRSWCARSLDIQRPLKMPRTTIQGHEARIRSLIWRLLDKATARQACSHSHDTVRPEKGKALEPAILPASATPPAILPCALRGPRISVSFTPAFATLYFCSVTLVTPPAASPSALLGPSFTITCAPLPALV